MQPKDILQECHCQSKYVDVLGSKMHYLEAGAGKTILFLHGIPTSSYLWRKVIPSVAKYGRCIAPDLIGMGWSDKPNIPYRVFDHIHYIEAFVEALGLKDIVLVMHGWGSLIGFDYASHHEENVSALVFFESHLRPVTKQDMVSLPIQELASVLKTIDLKQLTNDNQVVDRLIKGGSMRKLTEEELGHYREPFKTPEDRKPILQYLKDYPIQQGAQDVVKLIESYSQKLQQSLLPKLMFYAVPGFNTPVDTVMWARDHLKNITIEDLGEDMHYVQETKPCELGEKIAAWIKKVVPFKNLSAENLA
jgi:haloalkane dehalogenase